MTTEEQPQQSPQAPEPTPQRIFTLVQKIDLGDIKLPTFQRPQVWNVQQAINLLDSVKNGYPIGSLLFWETSHELQAERNIGGFELPDTPQRYPRNYILDGQQRLTTLYAVLTHHPNQLEERLRVVYDLSDKEFVEARDSIGPLQVPLSPYPETGSLEKMS